MNEEIMALCRAMGACEDQEELLLPLVQAVSEQLAGRLRAGVGPEDCGPAFPLAAAMTAMDQLAGLTGENKLSSFTAGELTIRCEAGDGGRKGDSLTQQADRLLSPWLGDAGFAFQEVQG